MDDQPQPSGGFGGLSNIFTGIQQIVLAIRAANQILKSTFPQQGGTSATATGGAATLPANPVGFIIVTLPNGTSARVPYYSP